MSDMKGVTMQELKTDKEFQNLIPPVTPEEFKGLEDSILAEGCRLEVGRG